MRLVSDGGDYPEEAEAPFSTHHPKVSPIISLQSQPPNPYLEVHG